LGGTEFGVAAVAITKGGKFGGEFAGRVIGGKTLRILAEDGNEAPPGEHGLLRVSSRCLAEGYLEAMPDGTYHLDAFDAADGVATGDVGFMDSHGLVRISGRAGRMVKRGGKWLDTRPLVDFLSGHAGVHLFALEKIGDSRESTAWLVPNNRGKIELSRLREEMVATLGESPLVPARLVTVSSIPVNRHGKANPGALNDPRNLRLILEINEQADRVEEIAGEVKERLLAGRGSFRTPFVSELEGLDSLHWHELAAAVEVRTGRSFSIADLIALNRGDETVLDAERAGLDGLRVFHGPQFSKGPAKVARQGILWFGGGIGTVTATAEAGTTVWHWDCDRCMASPVTWKGSTIESMAIHFLGQVDSMPAVLRIGGFSLGALVAFEVTRLLVARGKLVEACILVDPPEPRGVFGGALNRLAAAITLTGVDRLMRLCGKQPKPSLAARIRRAARRLALLRYRGGIPAAPTHLFTSDRNRGVAKSLIHGNGGLVNLVSLGVKRHVESVRNAQAVNLWSRCLVSERSNGPGHVSRAA